MNHDIPVVSVAKALSSEAPVKVANIEPSHLAQATCLIGQDHEIINLDPSPSSLQADNGTAECRKLAHALHFSILIPALKVPHSRSERRVSSLCPSNHTSLLVVTVQPYVNKFHRDRRCRCGKRPNHILAAWSYSTQVTSFVSRFDIFSSSSHAFTVRSISKTK